MNSDQLLGQRTVGRFFGVTALLLSTTFSSTAETLMNTPLPREKICFTDNWRFHKGDPNDITEDLSYKRLKPWLLPSANAFKKETASRPEETPPGEQSTFAQPDFNDSDWRKLNLPHDWGIEGPFDIDLPGETAKLPWFGIGWYRKTFDLPQTAEGKRIFLQVDGAMSYAAVWCNGKFVGGWPYGYASWQLDLTPYLKPGEQNTLAIRIDNPEESSRWYPGGGIYRNVWLIKTDPVHIAQWGVQITTPKVNDKQAIVEIVTSISNSSTNNALITANTQIYKLDAQGERIGAPVSTQGFKQQITSTPPNSKNTEKATLRINNPLFWSLENPNLYVAETTVRQGTTILDLVETPFGIRTIDFIADRGFLLNGELIELKGVCLHHDLGALGAAFNLRAANVSWRSCRRWA